MARISHIRFSVGVSGANPHSKSVRMLMKRFRSERVRVIFLSGVVQNITQAAQSDMARIDALILMGNDLDIDPSCYTGRYAADDPKRKHHPQTRSEFATPQGKLRARYEDALLKQALARGMPVLGICGGMHRINVLCGGTLHQHIPDLVGCDKHRQHRQGIAPHIPVVPIIIKDNTKLGEIAEGIAMPFVKKDMDCPQVIMENSMHHQAVDIVGLDLRVCAVTDTIRLRNGTAGYMAQAIESDPEGKFSKQFILGVQWHPEFGASPLGGRIIQHLIRAMHDYNKAPVNLMKNIIFKAKLPIYCGENI